MMNHSQDTTQTRPEDLRKQRDILTYRMKRLSGRQGDITKQTSELKQKIQKKYDDMKRVLDEDLRITMCQLDMEQEAVERCIEENIERCCHLVQELDRGLDQLSKPLDQRDLPSSEKILETNERISEILKSTDPESVQMDQVKNEQLLGLTSNLLLFIRSQVPVTKKLFQSYAREVVLNSDSAHPKLVVSPAGDSVAYTDTWRDVPDNPSRFDATLNVMSRDALGEGRNYWEVQVSGKTYWELGLAYPGIPRKGLAEECWLGRGPESWAVEFFNGEFTAWHGGAARRLEHVRGRDLGRVGVFSSSLGGLVCFLGADTMTPLHGFSAGAFTAELHPALCPGHHDRGANRGPLQICDASRSAPVL